MSTKVLIEVDTKYETTLRRALALAEQWTLTAPEGTVFDACEDAVIEKGRDLQTQLLIEAVARRVEAAEKKGGRCGSARAVERKRIVVPRPGSSSVRSASSI